MSNGNTILALAISYALGCVASGDYLTRNALGTRVPKLAGIAAVSRLVLFAHRRCAGDFHRIP